MRMESIQLESYSSNDQHESKFKIQEEREVKREAIDRILQNVHIGSAHAADLLLKYYKQLGLLSEIRRNLLRHLQSA